MTTSVHVLSLLLASAAVAVAVAIAADTCADVGERCKQGVRCGEARLNLDISCGAETAMTSRNCSTPCRRAFLTFAVTDMGYEYLERCACDAADWRCKNTKTAHRLCKDVDVRTGNGVDCDVAEERCRHDVTCNLGLTYFRSHCGDMLEGEQCTELCNRTISVLYWSQTGADFLFCACSERSARTECDMRRMFMHELCDFPHESRRRSDRDAATPTSASPWVVAIAAAAACVVASLARVELPPTP